MLHVDCPDADWNVPGLQMDGSALPCGHAWPGGHWCPVTQSEKEKLMFTHQGGRYSLKRIAGAFRNAQCGVTET